LAAGFAAFSAAAATEILKQEPPMGALKEGQRVLVDDGSCGPGKIKEVIGGNHVLAGGNLHIVRQRHCIPTPK
jgi:hypothetical protein